MLDVDVVDYFFAIARRDDVYFKYVSIMSWMHAAASRAERSFDQPKLRNPHEIQA